MAICKETNIPVLNIQEGPCIQGSLLTSCIFYGLAIDYIGSQNTSSLFDIIQLLVIKLEQGNIDATNLEEDNRAQSLLIEELQETISVSLVTLSEIQSALEECCPEPTTTTTTTTTVATTTTTTIPTTSTTTSSGVNYVFFTSGSNPTEACNSNNFVSLYWAGNSNPNGKEVFIDSNLTEGYYVSGFLVTGGNVYNSSNGYLFLQGSCSSYTTTTIPPTTNGVGPTINANYSGTACDTSGGSFQTVTLVNGTSICDTNVYLSSGFYMLPTQFYMTYQGVSRLFQKDSQNQFAYPQGSCIDCSATTTTTTTTIAPITSYSFTVAASSTSDRNYSCSNLFTSGQQTLWASTYIPGDVQKFYTDSNLTNPYIGNVNDYYAYMIGWPSGILYTGQMGADGTMFNKSVCEEPTTTTTSTTTAAPTTTTSTTACVKPAGLTNVLLTSDVTYNSNSYDFETMTFEQICTALQGYCSFGGGGMQEFMITGETIGIEIGNSIYTTNSPCAFLPNGNYVVGQASQICSGPRTIISVLNGIINAIDSPCTYTAPTTTTTTTVAPGTLGFLGDFGDGPKSIVLDTASNVYIAAQNSSTTFKITSTGLDNSYGLSTNPEDLAIDSSGNVYAITTINNNIIKILPNGTSSIFATLPSQGNQITIDSLGNLYTLHRNQNTIYKIQPNGTVTNFGSIDSDSYSFVTDSQNNLYVPSLMGNTILKFTPSGTKTTFVTFTQPPNPRKIAVDSLDNLYVSSNINNVYKITPSGNVTTMATLGTNLQDLAVDINGNVYVTDIIYGKIYKITPSGTVTDLVTMSGMYDPIATDSNYVYFGISNGNTYKIKL